MDSWFIFESRYTSQNSEWTIMIMIIIIIIIMIIVVVLFLLLQQRSAGTFLEVYAFAKQFQ